MVERVNIAGFELPLKFSPSVGFHSSFLVEFHFNRKSWYMARLKNNNNDIRGKFRTEVKLPISWQDLAEKYRGRTLNVFKQNFYYENCCHENT